MSAALTTATNPPMPLWLFALLVAIVTSILLLARAWVKHGPTIDAALADPTPTYADQPPMHPNCRCVVDDGLMDLADAVQEPYPLLTDAEFARLHLLFLRDQGVQS